MKTVLMAIVLLAMLAPALPAQRGPGGGGEGEAQPRSAEERLADLHRLMRKAGKEMEKLEQELARASQDAPRPDVVAERIERMRRALQEGRLDDLPEGMVEYLRKNPDSIAGETELTVDDVLRIIKEHEETERGEGERRLTELEQLLERNPELLKRLAENESAMDEVRSHQHGAERRLEEALKRQNETVETARERVDEAIEYAHTLRGR
jgi:hypothetical protein